MFLLMLIGLGIMMIKLIHLRTHATLLIWCSRKKKSVAQSSMEVEDCAIATKNAKHNWIHNLHIEIHYFISSLTSYCYNVRATYFHANPMFHSRVKHIAINSHFVWD